MNQADVRFGSEADILGGLRDVLFTPRKRPLMRATSGAVEVIGTLDIEVTLSAASGARFAHSRLGSSASLDSSAYTLTSKVLPTLGFGHAQRERISAHDSRSPYAARYSWTISRAQGPRRNHG